MSALPINIEELLNGHVVEWERLEFKAGWNPEDIVHSMCAFANDLNNWGGGYLILGVKEDKGRPVLPPIGFPENMLDAIQKELINLGHRLRPHYHPIAVPTHFQGKMILILWCPGGPTRPYQAPESLGKKVEYYFFIRRNSSTVHAQGKDMQRLYELASQIPFDDRICHQADLNDLKPPLIKEFLREIKSDLLEEADHIPFKQLCRQMQIVQGPDEFLKPLNIGLLMFNEDPDRFFPCARIEVVDFHDDGGDSFSEKIFKGPLHVQLREALRYIQSMFLREEVRKKPDRAEADRFYNYPYIAIEEALANAVYHKEYSKREPIEVRIHPDRIEILSFPGPMPPLTVEDLNQGPVNIRNYRNRRIGDLLKELHLTEGRCTGLPKIQKAMKKNGSPPAIFKTDKDLLYFLTIFPIHPELIVNRGQLLSEQQESQQELQQGSRQESKSDTTRVPLRNQVLALLKDEPLSRSEIAKELDQKKISGQLNVVLKYMLEERIIAYTIPEKPNSRLQKYRSEQQELQQGSRQESKSDTTRVPLRDQVLTLLKHKPLSRSEIAKELEQKKISGQLNVVLKYMLEERIIAYTIPEKPNSRLQKYRIVN